MAQKEEQKTSKLHARPQPTTQSSTEHFPLSRAFEEKSRENLKMTTHLPRKVCPVTFFRGPSDLHGRKARHIRTYPEICRDFLHMPYMERRSRPDAAHVRSLPGEYLLLIGFLPSSRPEGVAHGATTSAGGRISASSAADGPFFPAIPTNSRYPRSRRPFQCPAGAFGQPVSSGGSRSVPGSFLPGPPRIPPAGGV